MSYNRNNQFKRKTYLLAAGGGTGGKQVQVQAGRAS
jgi:hypothetical protein